MTSITIIVTIIIDFINTAIISMYWVMIHLTWWLLSRNIIVFSAI